MSSNDALNRHVTDELFWDPKVDSAAIAVTTLTGTVSWSYQRDEAEFVATNIAGVLDVIDEITIAPPAQNGYELRESIKQAFKRNASFHAEALTVSSTGGAVTISGNVRVTSVRDQITISY
jgi:osmotically-inducible protein OsmY